MNNNNTPKSPKDLPLPRAGSTDIEVFLENLTDNMDSIMDRILSLPSFNQSFAKSMYEGFQKYSSLTPKQLPYAVQMWQFLNMVCDSAEELEDRHATSSVRGQTPAELPVKAPELIALMQKAYDSGILWPRIRLHLRKGEYSLVNGIRQLTIQRLSDSSKYPGSILIKVYNSDDWIVRLYINDNYSWHPGWYYKTQLQQGIRQIVQLPITEIIARAKELGTCCFCGHELENSISVAHGYGPICAANYGLPWEEQQTTLEEIL